MRPSENCWSPQKKGVQRPFLRYNNVDMHLSGGLMTAKPAKSGGKTMQIPVRLLETPVYEFA
jgi:hypothetical protein